jgi:hypothetical protein
VLTTVHTFNSFWITNLSLLSASCTGVKPLVFFPLLYSSVVFCLLSESESYITTDGQPASLSWNKASIWGLRPDFYYCLTVAGLLILGALSDERTGLSFTIAAGPCQRSLSRVRPYFTVSDLRLPFSSPPTTRRVTVEVFDPASTRVFLSSVGQFSPGGRFWSNRMEITSLKGSPFASPMW